MENRSRIDLPPQVAAPYEVFVNGVLQVEGEDYDVFGSSLVFRRQLAREGKLGFWRWLSISLGIAGTYRKHEAVSVVYTANGHRAVVELAPREVDG